MGKKSFLQALMAPEYWEGLEWSETLAWNGIGYCVLGNDLCSVFPTRNTMPLLELFIGIDSMAYFLSIHSLSSELEQVTFLSLTVG